MNLRDMALLGLRTIILPTALVGGLLAYNHCSKDRGRLVPEVIQYHDGGHAESESILDEPGLNPVRFGTVDEPILPEEVEPDTSDGELNLPSGIEFGDQLPEVPQYDDPPAQSTTPPLEQIVEENEPVQDDGVAEQREIRRYTIRINLSTNTATLSYHDMTRNERGRFIRGDFHEVDETYRVISGMPSTQTNEGEFVRRRLLINPRWNMPESIVNERRDYYMTARDENGDHIYHHGGRFYVNPGPHNPLGRMFLPLRDGQGVHSTNDTAKFDRRRRYLSHGCVRYQGITEIFEEILRHNNYQVFDVWRSWTEPVEGIDPSQILQSGEYTPRLMIRMDPPVEVIVTRSQ